MFRRLSLSVLGALLMMTIAACGQQAATGTAPGATEEAGAATMEGGMQMTATTTHAMPMDMSSTAMPMGSSPFDAQFIDSMIEHHRGAIAMAEQGLRESERPEIKELAQNIISSQQQEIEQMTSWRSQWYPELEPTAGMGMAMGDMEISTDTSQPFDQRFITAMIGHHNGAIMMAREAQTKAEHPEIKQLADAVIKAQEAEVTQMQQWSSEWFGS